MIGRLTLLRAVRILVLAGCLSGPDPSLMAAGSISIEEHFYQQDAAESLLIRVNPFEAEYEVRVLDPGGRLLLASGLAHSSLAPLFMFIDRSGASRQLDIQIRSPRFSNRHRFELGVTHVTAKDERTARLSGAYRALSFGLQLDGTQTTPGWTVKISSLLDAARLFDQYGMQELSLWSQYYAAHLVQHQLHDYNSSLELAGRLLSRVEATQFQDIKLAVMQLQSAALASLGQIVQMAPGRSDPDPVQSSFTRLAGLAGALGYRYEHARALYSSALDFAGRGRYAEALEQFRLALEIADELEADSLSRETRENIVEIHDLRGDVIESAEVLREIESRLARDNAGEALARNLLQQAELLILNSRFPEAIEVLQQALEYQNNSMTRALVNIALGKAHFESGQFESAVSALEQSVLEPGASEVRQTSALLDLSEALRVQANSYRALRSLEPMDRARALQQDHLSEQAIAAYWYEKGLDELARNPTGSQGARSAFQRARQAAGQLTQPHLERLSVLQICAHDPGPACNRDEARQAVNEVIGMGVPRYSAEARLLWSRYLDRQGSDLMALVALEQLLDEIYFYRETLPGVLGDWYWIHRSQIFSDYLDARTATADAAQSLLALSKTRHIDHAGEMTAASSPNYGQSVDTDELRAQLARLREQPGAAGEALRDSIKPQLSELRDTFRQATGFLSSDGLRAYLEGLGRNKAVLTFRLEADSATAWLGVDGNVQRFALQQPEKIARALQDAQSVSPIPDPELFHRSMDTLGQLLIGPLEHLLPETIYWIPSRPMMGIPLDALRLKGRYLAQSRQVVNLMSFPGGKPSEARPSVLNIKAVFIAGHPLDFSAEFALELETSEEIRLVAEHFIGPHLYIVQGRSLLPPELNNERLASADLVHLSMPGVNDIGNPPSSGLQFSEERRGEGRIFVGSQELGLLALQARLVVLSNTSLASDPGQQSDYRPGLVTALLDAGADSVMATLFPGSGQTNPMFINDFYRNLKQLNNAGAALAATKRQYLAADDPDLALDWARFQLYVD